MNLHSQPRVAPPVSLAQEPSKERLLSALEEWTTQAKGLSCHQHCRITIAGNSAGFTWTAT